MTYFARYILIAFFTIFEVTIQLSRFSEGITNNYKNQSTPNTNKIISTNKNDEHQAINPEKNLKEIFYTTCVIG